jgi:N-formylglutamate amidohydrolase
VGVVVRMTPIIEFKSQEQADKCLKEWQERLFLTDWIIVIRISEPHEFSMPERMGENEFQLINKTGVIRILNKKYYGERITKYCAELTLIHELLHCKIDLFENNNTLEGIAWQTTQHQLIEELAKSLLMAKYNLKLDWFKEI